jgi:hypothetical protein
MSKWSVHGKIKVTASLVATVCVPAKLGHVFAVGSLSYAQRSFGEVAKFPFWARTKLHKQVLQKMATLVYYPTCCRDKSVYYLYCNANVVFVECKIKLNESTFYLITYIHSEQHFITENIQCSPF